MDYTQEVKQTTDPIYKKISKVMPEIEWSVHAPYIHKINKLMTIMFQIDKFLYGIYPRSKKSYRSNISENF